jgi:23S rRNA-/tRNA-specific pseudouridylate synthase
MLPIAERIIYQDRELVVVDKPPGLVSCGPDRLIHGEAAPRESVESLLVGHLGRRVWAVHQLDRMTSGLNCFVLKASLVALWAERLKVPGTKHYLAIVHGAAALEEMRVDLPLGERRVGPKTFPAVVPAGDPTAKPAQSRVRFLSSSAAFALAHVIPETGRTHQVRLHLAALGHPLVGEPLHREPPCTLHERHALHAFRLVFDGLELTSPWPEDLIALAARLGLSLPAR